MASFKRIGLLLAFFFSFSHFCFSQDSLRLKPPDEYVYLVPRHAVKLSALHPLFFYPTVQVAYEFKLSSRYTLQADAGYVFNHRENDPEFQNKRGTKLKVELRHYLHPDLHFNDINYYSIEPYVHIVNFDRQETVSECFDVDCTILYSRKYSYKVLYREAGLAFKYGYLKYYNRLIVDFNLGLALRFVNYIKPDLPSSNQSFQDDIAIFSWDIPNENKRIAVGPVLDLRFGYRLR